MNGKKTRMVPRVVWQDELDPVQPAPLPELNTGSLPTTIPMAETPTQRNLEQEEPTDIINPADDIDLPQPELASAGMGDYGHRGGDVYPQAARPSPADSEVYGTLLKDMTTASASPDYSEAKRREMSERVNPIGLIGTALAGFGDVMGRRYGGQTDFMSASMKAQQLKRAEDLAQFDREKAEFEEKDIVDPNSSTSRVLQSLVADATGRDVSEFAGIPGKKIMEFLPKISGLAQIKLATEIKKQELGIKEKQAAKDEADKIKAEEERKEKAGVEANKTIFEQENKLRDEYTKSAENFSLIRDSYQRILGSKPTAAGDLALIFNYMKLLDPRSVVRESEFQTAANAGSYGARIQGLVKNLSTGQKLAPSVRADFMRQASDLYESMKSIHDRDQKRYKMLATEYGLNPERIVTPLGIENPLGPEGQAKAKARQEEIKRLEAEKALRQQKQGVK